MAAQTLRSSPEDLSDTRPRTGDTVQGASVLPGLVFQASKGNSPRVSHPSPTTANALWRVFIDTVEPLNRVFDRAWLEQMMRRVPSTAQENCLAFAMYFTATSTLALTELNAQHDLRRWEYGLEQSLSDSRFMNQPSLGTLYALVLYLSCSHILDKTYVQSMTSVAIRQAFQLNLHKDCAEPPDRQVRRALWRLIFALDVKVADACQTEPLILKHQFDPKLGSDEIEDTHSGPEQQVYNLVMQRLPAVVRRTIFSRRWTAANKYPVLTRKDKLAALKKIEEQVQLLQVHPTRELVELLRATSIKLHKYKLIVLLSEADKTSIVDLEKILNSSLQLADVARSLRTDGPNFWLDSSCPELEWDAVAVSLLCLAYPMPRDLSHHGWSVVDNFCDYWSERVDSVRQRKWNQLNALAMHRRLDNLSKSDNAPTASLLEQIRRLDWKPWSDSLFGHLLDTWDEPETIDLR